MATMYWISSTSQNFATTGAWSNTATGASNGTSPGASDVATFTSNFSGTCTIAASVSLVGFDCNDGTNGAFTGTITHNAFTITITGTGAGAFRFSSGMTYTPVGTSSLVTFANTTTSSVAILTCAGQKFFVLSVNNTGSGVNGVVRLADTLNVNFGLNATLTITSGVFDAATNTAAINAC